MEGYVSIEKIEKDLSKDNLFAGGAVGKLACFPHSIGGSFPGPLYLGVPLRLLTDAVEELRALERDPQAHLREPCGHRGDVGLCSLSLLSRITIRSLKRLWIWEQ